MRAVIQRVTEASVTVSGDKVSEIGRGLLVLLGVGEGDGESQVDWLVRKITQLRIFEDDNEHMNLSVTDVGGNVIVVSQFTLYADCRKGNRPSFISAAPAEQANALYELLVSKLKAVLGENRVGTGVFQTHMEVRLLNDGPVTIVLETP
jgi:D-tyrosyl-tRNA(Tyr) deacylase